MNKSRKYTKNYMKNYTKKMRGGVSESNDLLLNKSSNKLLMKISFPIL